MTWIILRSNGSVLIIVQKCSFCFVNLSKYFALKLLPKSYRFCKSHCYAYHFVDLNELILNIYMYFKCNLLFVKYKKISRKYKNIKKNRDFSVFTKSYWISNESESKISPGEYIWPYKNIHLESTFHKL